MIETLEEHLGDEEVEIARNCEGSLFVLGRITVEHDHLGARLDFFSTEDFGFLQKSARSMSCCPTIGVTNC